MKPEVKIDHENLIAATEYAHEMGITVADAVNEALRYYFPVIGAANREHRIEQQIKRYQHDKYALQDA
jgi:hypothetical protein